MHYNYYCLKTYSNICLKQSTEFSFGWRLKGKDGVIVVQNNSFLFEVSLPLYSLARLMRAWIVSLKFQQYLKVLPYYFLFQLIINWSSSFINKPLVFIILWLSYIVVGTLNLKCIYHYVNRNFYNVVRLIAFKNNNSNVLSKLKTLRQQIKLRRANFRWRHVHTLPCQGVDADWDFISPRVGAPQAASVLDWWSANRR